MVRPWFTTNLSRPSIITDEPITLTGNGATSDNFEVVKSSKEVKEIHDSKEE